MNTHHKLILVISCITPYAATFSMDETLQPFKPKATSNNNTNNLEGLSKKELISLIQKLNTQQPNTSSYTAPNYMPPQQPIIILNKLENKQAQKSSSQAHATAQAKATTYTTIRNQIKNYIPNNPYNNALQFLHTHKNTLILSSIGLTYSALSYRMLAMRYYLRKSDTWSAWKKEYTLDELKTQDPSQLIKEFMIIAQQEYANPHNPTDYASPMTALQRAIDHEIIYVEKYLTMIKWLSRGLILWIFPARSHDIKQAKKRLKRLYYLSSLYMHWALEYKINMLNGQR